MIELAELARQYHTLIIALMLCIPTAMFIWLWLDEQAFKRQEAERERHEEQARFVERLMHGARKSQ